MNKNINLIHDLQNRGLIAQITNEKKLVKILNSKKIFLYCGFDPTADSLHLGHLAPLICLRKFQKAGHFPLIILGGATGLIGDPSFKISERLLHNSDTTQKWIEKIKKQILLFIKYKKEISINNYIINNHDWFSSMNILSFLRNVGKFFSVNKMINKDIIQQRLKKENSGISYTEFSYNLLQSYDFAYLYKNYNVILQIGGSDQWGNIISGIDLTRRMYKKEVYGLTVPLITKSDNIKFGKTEKNTIWLDKKKTSSYKFYQYWLNSSDQEVYKFLKLFTDIEIEKIDALEKEEKLSNKKPRAQIILADELTRLVHGIEELKIAKQITKKLFSMDILNLDIHDFEQLKKNGMLIVKLKIGETILKALVKSNLAFSYTQARLLLSSNGITINSKKITAQYIFTDSDRIFGKYTLLKRGKKNFCLIEWI